MKKCNICGNEIKEDESICNKCGHDFSFKYKKNARQYNKQFVYTKKDLQDDELPRAILLVGALILWIIVCCVIGFLY